MLTDKEQEEIRRKLLGLEEEPPATAWNKIAADIRPPRKPRLVWWWWFGAALLLLLSTGGIYQLLNQDNQPLIVSEETVIDKQAQSNAEITVTDEAGGARTSAAEAGKSVKAQNTVTGQTQHSESEVYSSEKAAEAEPEKLQDENLSETGGNLHNKPDVKGRPIMPIVIGAERPKSKYIPELKAGEHEVTITRVTKGKSEQQPVAEPETTVASYESNTSEFIVGKVAVLRTSGKVILPDSVLLALLPDSTKKTMAVAADTSEEGKNKEWYIGLTFAPRYTFRSFTPTTADDIYITKLNNYKKLDPKRMGYEFGLNIGKKISPKLYLESSLTLMQLQENVSYAFTNGKVDTLIKSRTKDGSYQATPVYIEGCRQLESTFTYGGLRVGLSYYFLESTRSRFNLTFAGGANLLIKGRTREYINGELKETIVFPSEENLLEQTNYNLLIGAGYNMMIRNKFELMLMPSLNYFLGSTFSKREPFGLRPYTLGVSVQLKRRFMN